MPKAAITFGILFGAALIAASLGLACQSVHSDPDTVCGGILLGLPAMAIIGGLSIFATTRAIRRGTLRARRALLAYGVILCLAWATFEITSRCLVPPNINFAFSYPGNTGTYQAVQFYFKHDGHWLEGPSVEGWPLKVSFPDLNGDGYPDIQVRPETGGGSVEFVYLPQNDGHIFWRAIQNDTGLSAAYPPANYFSNYP